MEGYISTSHGGGNVIHVEFEEARPESMTKEELEVFHLEELYDFLIDTSIPWEVIDALHASNIDKDTLLETDELPRVMNQVSAEQNIVINVAVREAIKGVIERAKSS